MLSTGPFPVPLLGCEPLGSLIYQGSVDAQIMPVGETDRFTIDLDAGQTVTLVVDPNALFQPVVELFDPDGSPMDAAAATAPGEEAVLQVIPITTPGQYTVAVAGLSNTTGFYTLELILNAAVESESHGGPTNDDPASAEDLDSSFIALGDGSAERGAVLGTLTGNEDWYRFTLDDGDSSTLALNKLTPGEATLELYDSVLSPLAKGVTADNLDQAVNNFVDATSNGTIDIYFARVTADSPTDYTLVITRNADLDTEPNCGPDGMQEIAPRGVTLGNLGLVPAVEQQRLVASDAASGNQFGWSVCVSGETAMIGTPFVDDELGSDYGVVYAFRFDGTEWLERQRLTASDLAESKRFGYSVAVDGNVAIIGAYGDDHAGPRSGAAYVFGFDGSQWVQRQKLTASDAAGEDRFGDCVSISGDTVIVGADGHDDHGSNSGSAYVFRFDGNHWVEQQKLTASDAAAQDCFGTSVSVDGGTAVVGAPYDDDVRSQSGSAYFFHFDGAEWVEQQKLGASDANSGDSFGCSVSISGDTAIVGAERDDDVRTDSGSVYVFRFDGSRWVQQQKLTDPDPFTDAWFGHSVSIDGETAIVGADYDRLGDGSACVFQFNGSQWRQKQKLTASDAAGGARFGCSVSVSDGIAMVGGHGSDEFALNAGSAYVFGPAPDEYAVSADTGDPLVITTSTPSDQPGQFDNELDPSLELYDPEGTLVARDSNGAPDGRNGRLEYTAPMDGGYIIRVLREGFTHGEYLLSITGQTGPLPPFQVATTDPADAEQLTARPVPMTVHFGDGVLLSSLEAADLTVNGLPPTAVDLIDGKTAVFDLSDVAAEGLNQVAIAAGAILDLQGTPIEPFATTFLLDAMAPRVIASSVTEGQIVPTGGLVYTASFDEPLRAASLGSSDVTLVGQLSGPHVPQNFVYDPVDSTLRMQFADLPEDEYVLTLLSGRYQFEDLVRHALDGEPHPVTTVPSGDGVEGGDFVVHFAADIDAAGPAALPVPLSPKDPLGSLVYDSAYQGILRDSSDTDRFEIELDDGQTITLVVDPDATLRPTVELLDPAGGSMGSATAAAAGEEAVLEVVPTAGSGTYTVIIDGALDTVGAYTVQLILNAAVEAESHGGPTNDDPASAEDLEASFISLGDGWAERGAVLGTLAGSEDWYHFTLDDGESATLALEALSGPEVALELYDGSLNLLAMGAAAANLSRVINNFVDGTTNGAPDTYYARVTGDPLAEYNLVVTRNADFDTEPNHAGAPQEIMPSGNVLGELGFAQQEKLTASDADEYQHFGDVVAISGDAAIIGADHSAYIFRRDGSGWVEEQKLSVPDTVLYQDRVAISNDVAMVGARYNDDAAENAGAVWVFRFDGTGWTQEQVLLASDAAEDDYFGSSVGVDGNTAVVGAYGAGSGAAYVLRFDGSQWVEQQKLTASDGAGGSEFGRSVAIRGDAIIVGTVSAYAYVFRFDGTQWSEQGKLIASGGMTDGWACSVAIDGDTALIGARRSDTTVEDSGSAHVFRFDGNQWIEEQKLIASDAASEDRFGQSVAISGDTVVVGAYYDDDLGSRSGSAYIFHFDGSRWTQQQKLTASDGAADDRFARAVSISGNTIIMGAYGNDHAGEYSGSAYIFSVDPDDYAVNVQAGDALVITTSTPAGGPGEFANDLDPMVELYDPDGTLVATDDNSAPDGRNVLLTHSAAVRGPYTVRVLGAQATCGEYTLHVTGHTGPLPAPPRVIASSIGDGEAVPTGTLIYTARFDERLNGTNLDPSDVTLVGRFSGAHVPVALAYDPASSTLALEFAGLPEDAYTLSLLSGNGRFEDLLGYDLDGAPSFPLPSGDGVGGDDFVVDFFADDPVSAHPIVVQPAEPPGSLIYAGSLSEVMIAAQSYRDRTSIDLDAGQTIMVVVQPEGQLQPMIEVFGPDGPRIGTATAATAGGVAVLQTVHADTSGTYTIDIAGASSTTGVYLAQLILNAAVEAESYGGPANDDPASAEDLDGSFILLGDGPAQRGAVLGTAGTTADWYRFTLDDGATTTLALAARTTGNLTLDLYDADLNRLTAGVPTAELSGVINNFVDGTSDGTATTYFAHVAGDSGTDYSLVVTRNADFDTEPNNDPAHAQEIMPSEAVLGHLYSAPHFPSQKLIGSTVDRLDEFGTSVSISGEAAIVGAPEHDSTENDGGAAYVFTVDPDDYAVSVQPGDTLVIATATPAGGPGEFVNNLDPAIELYDPTGLLVASDDNGAPDARNARLVHVAEAAGTYTVRVVAAGGTFGEYVLNVTGPTGPLPAFEVVATDPPDGTRFTSPPTRMTVSFNDPVLADTLDAADLTVNGQPATAVELIDTMTAVFDVPTHFNEGVNHVAIAAGAIRDLQRAPIEAFGSTLVLDTTAPRVVTSSIGYTATVPTGTLLYVAQFDEQLDATSLDPSDVALVGHFSGAHSPQAFSYDPAGSTLTLEFAALPEDVYLLSLQSGNGRFEDLVGHSLDGEVDPATTVPSGDGVAGGDFVLKFIVDGPAVLTPPALEGARPRGSLVYSGSLEAIVGALGFLDTCSVTLDGQHTMTVVVDPDAMQQPTIEVLDPGGVSIGTAAASNTGTEAVLQCTAIVSPGTYTILIGNLSAAAGTYTAQLILNAAVEDESHDGPANDDSAVAQDLDNSFIRLGHGPAERAAVLGTAGGSEDWYRFTLHDGGSATLALTARTPADVVLELYDDTSDLLATGVTAANLSQVISNFIDESDDGVPDSYFVRVVCDSLADYGLLITRDGDFDTEPNSVPGQSQDIPPSGAVLGSLRFLPQFQQRKLTASDAAVYDRFGHSVSIDGDNAIVGAPGNDDAGEESGSAYVFHFTGSLWVEQQKLTAPDPVEGASFGRSVSIDGNTAIVGAYCDDDAGEQSGSAYVFRFDGTQWVVEQKLTASDAASGDRFGFSVAIDRDTAIVGAYRDDDAGSDSGSAYVFHRDGNRWVEQRKLTASDAAAQDWFGYSVSIAGGKALVGAIGNDDGGSSSGAAYAFHSDGGRWVEQQKLTASDTAAGDIFGISVSIAGDVMIIGAPDNSDDGHQSGSAYVFQFDGSQWVEQRKLTASDAAANDNFGVSVSIAGDTAIVGAYSNHEVGSNTGSAYVFRIDGNQWIEQQKLTGADSVAGIEYGCSVAISGGNAMVAFDYDDNRGAAYVFAPDSDNFAVNVEAGQMLVVETATPGGGPGEFVNELDPAVVLYDPDGVLVASNDNGAADGRNVLLVHAAAVTGRYTVCVLATNGTQGEYVLHVMPIPGAVPVGRFVFYNHSSFDGNDPAVGPADDAAIAVGKVVLLPGQMATFANYTSYSGGINGIMVDIAGLAGTPTVDDFEFRVGNDNDPSAWDDAPAPADIAVRWGEGAGGSDRVTLIWPDRAIQKQWLQVTVLPGGNTGLLEADVFYFGNAIGESGNSATDAKVNATDMLAARNHPRTFINPAPIDFPYDFNRDARVNATDMLIARNNQTSFLDALKLITAPASKAAGAQESIFSIPFTGESSPRAIKANLGEGEGLAPTEDVCICDLVLEENPGRESGDRRTSPCKLDWLYEFEQVSANRQPAKKEKTAEDALDQVLVGDWQ